VPPGRIQAPDLRGWGPVVFLTAAYCLSYLFWERSGIGSAGLRGRVAAFPGRK